MSYTIYSKSNAFPVAVAGSKTVRTFPSGLVLVTQEYAVPRGQEDTYAATFAVGQPLSVDSPAIDGLYIFPEPEWIDNGDGFTRLSVSAYGRSSVNGQKTFSKILGSIGVRYSKTDSRGPRPPEFVFVVGIPTIKDLMIWQFVLPKNTAPNITVSDGFKIYRLTGENIEFFYLNEFFNRTGYNTINPSVVVTDPILIEVTKKLNRAENTNFGEWDEWTVVWEANTQSQVNFGDFYKILPPVGGPILREIELAPLGLPLDTLFVNLKNSGLSNNGNAFTILLHKVESVQTTLSGYGSNTQRTNLPSNTPVTSYRGGSVLWRENGDFEYTAPEITRPTIQPTFPGQTYSSNGFTWESIFDEDIYIWRFKTSYEIFVFTFRNELNQTGEGILTIKFVDPVYPALEE